VASDPEPFKMECSAGRLDDSKDQSNKDIRAEHSTSLKATAKGGRVQCGETKSSELAKTKCMLLIRHGTAVHNEYLLKLKKDKPETANKLWEEWLSQQDAISMGFPISSTNTPLTQKGVDEATALGRKLFEDGESFKDASGNQYGTVWDLDLIIVSPLLRTLQTCTKIFGAKPLINRNTKRKIDIVALEIVKEFPQGRHYANKIDVSVDELKRQFSHIDFKSLENHHKKSAMSLADLLISHSENANSPNTHDVSRKKQENPSYVETDTMWETAFKNSKGKGESRYDLKVRVERFLKMIRSMAAEKVAVVSHSSFLHGVLCGSSKDDSVGGSLAHCQPLVFLLNSSDDAKST